MSERNGSTKRLNETLKKRQFNDTIPCAAAQRAVLMLRKSFERAAKELRRSCERLAPRRLDSTVSFNSFV